jgi:ubiquitin C-terminal hydrolase
MEMFRQMAETKGIVGLTNIGNTCYGNATLQALRHQVDLTIFLLQENHKKILAKKESNEQTVLLEKYSELVHRMWKTENKYEKTHDFWSSMIPAAKKAGFEHFSFPQAHDSHEFLVFLLDTFHEALANPVKMVIK